MMVDYELRIKPQFLSRFFHAQGTDHPRSHRLKNMIHMMLMIDGLISDRVV